MIGRKNMKQETMAKRVRDKAAAKKMMSPRKKMDMGMSPGPDMGADSAPPMMPMGMKKGGMAMKKNYGSTEDIMGTGKTKAAAKADYAKKMKSIGMEPKFSKGGMAKKPGMKKGGMMLIIGIGKKPSMKKGK